MKTAWISLTILVAVLVMTIIAEGTVAARPYFAATYVITALIGIAREKKL